MPVATVNLFFGLLAAATALAAVGLVVAAATGRGAAVRAVVSPTAALWLAALVTGVATLGSLYYSEVVGFPPCELCWYQRIAMYPLPLLLGLAAVRRDPGVRPYAMAVAGVGALISAYHTQLEWFPAQESMCSAALPCSVPWFRTLGVFTLASMALSGFLFTIALLAVAGSSPRTDTSTDAPAAPREEITP
jgi:disulfide bond formation protein DsbB